MKILAGVALLMLTPFYVSVSFAASSVCGGPPKDVPQAVIDKIAADAQARAKVVETGGSITAEQEKLYQQHADVSRYMLDSYFSWVSCQTIFGDVQTMPDGKLAKWRTWYFTIFPEKAAEYRNNAPAPTTHEKVYLSSLLAADSPEKLRGDDREANQCYSPDPDHRFIPKTAVLDVIQNTQSNGFSAHNEYGISSAEPGGEKVCVHIKTQKDQTTHANITVRLRALMRNIYQ